MAAIDWTILCTTILLIVIYGVWKTRKSQGIDSYILGNNEARWWTVGLSVMATQASAITFLSTPGQAYHDGMGFVQFYFGLPLAMIIICITFIPIYHKLKVYTAYEFLEQRFDLKTRSLAASLFLIQRGLSAGITIYAPAIILSTILGWSLNSINIIIGVLVIIYTVSGGTKAVNVTQKQQMGVIFVGLVVAFYLILSYLPEGVGFVESLQIAGKSGKMDILDFSFDPESRYTFWSGITGGLFLALAYFGTDQSQVQRYLSGQSIQESRKGLIMNGLLKVPLQFFILLVGVMVFVFYQFHQAPLFFNPSASNIDQTQYASEYKAIEDEYTIVYNERQRTLTDHFNKTSNTPIDTKLKALNDKEKDLRQQAKTVIKSAYPSVETNDKDYVFISFILNHLPKGFVGLLLAMIFSAAMSSTASELNALGVTSTIDIYKRSVAKDKSENHYVFVSKLMTMVWGVIAIVFACYGSLFENLIQFVNIIGSLFYGTILGIFLVAFYFKTIKGNAVFYAAILSEVIVLMVYKADIIGYLWLNAIGCVLVVSISSIMKYVLKEYR